MFPDGAAVTQSSEASQPTAATDSQSSGTVSQAEQDNQVNDSLNETMDVTMQSGKFGRIEQHMKRFCKMQTLAVFHNVSSHTGTLFAFRGHLKHCESLSIFANCNMEMI